jgi:hypothetical protein
LKPLNEKAICYETAGLRLNLNQELLHSLIYRESDILYCLQRFQYRLGVFLTRDLPVNNFLDETSIHQSDSDSGRDLRSSQNSHNATCGYEKFDSGGFTARRERVNGEQEEDGVDACNTIELRVRLDAGLD